VHGSAVCANPAFEPAPAKTPPGLARHVQKFPDTGCLAGAQWPWCSFGVHGAVKNMTVYTCAASHCSQCSLTLQNRRSFSHDGRIALLKSFVLGMLRGLLG